MRKMQKIASISINYPEHPERQTGIVMNKIYTQAPLPFVGQKRNFLKIFNELLNKSIPNQGLDWTIVDVFGGSGLLSHTAKVLKPEATVIYNDFDNYSERLKHIDDTNRLRQQLHEITAHLPRNKRLSEAQKSKCQEIIQNFDGYVDAQTVASWLLFSGQQVTNLGELFAELFWNGVKTKDYEKTDNYLMGVEIVSESYTTLMPKFLDKSNTLFILDPPYLWTDQKAYNQQRFDLVSFLIMMELVRPPFIIFSSTKSEIVNYINYLVNQRQRNWQNFENYQRITVKASINKTASYEDNLIFKF